MWFPIDTETATVIGGVYEIDFGPYNQNRIINFIAIKGPVSSSCDVFLDTTFMDTTARGDFNRAEYLTGIPLAHGRQLRLVWSVGVGTLPIASLGMTDGNSTFDYTGMGQN